jgi:creatinine amidohydrolase
MENRTSLLEDMTWPEAEEALKGAQIGLVPVGSLEQHGPHLAMCADALCTYEFCKLVAQAIYPRAVVTGAIPFGVSDHHMAFPGTISIRTQTLIALAQDVGLSLKRHGLSHVVFVNGHGGNRDPLGVAATQLRFEHGVKAAHCLWPILGWQEGMAAASSTRVGHSCELEVSIMMHLSPRHVRADRLSEGEFRGPPLRYTGPFGVQVPQPFDEITANGAFEGAPKARPELGAIITEAAIRRMVEFIEDFVQT